MAPSPDPSDPLDFDDYSWEFDCPPPSRRLGRSGYRGDPGYLGYSGHPGFPGYPGYGHHRSLWRRSRRWRRLAVTLGTLVGVPIALFLTLGDDADGGSGARTAGPRAEAPASGGEHGHGDGHETARVPAPPVVTRAEWQADESLRDGSVMYTGAAKAVFVHHTAHAGAYDCAQAPAMLRAMYVDHVTAHGWDDIGYNFLVDRCGTVYEGRAGGVDRHVYGAHTKGFNADTVGIAVLGSFHGQEPVPQAVVDAIARITAWKLRPDIDPFDRVRLVSSNDASRYPEGETAELDVVAGHRDTYQTSCPGDALYARLPEIRGEVTRLRSAAQ